VVSLDESITFQWAVLDPILCKCLFTRNSTSIGLAHVGYVIQWDPGYTFKSGLKNLDVEQRVTYYDRQKITPPSPCNHLGIGALRLPTLLRNQAGDWLMPSRGRQPQHTDVQVVAGGDVFSYDSTRENNLPYDAMLSILDETRPIGRTNEWDLQLRDV